LQDVCPKFCDNQSTVLKYEIGKPRQKHAEREREREHIDHIRLLYFNFRQQIKYRTKREQEERKELRKERKKKERE